MRNTDWTHRVTLIACAFVAAFLVAVGSATTSDAALPDVVDTEPPLSGEALWQSLPPELLSNVIESKMEEMSSYQDRIRRLEAEIVRVQEIQASKLSVPRPPPDK